MLQQDRLNYINNSGSPIVRLCAQVANLASAMSQPDNANGGRTRKFSLVQSIYVTFRNIKTTLWPGCPVRTRNLM
jgi:hypothetical protein